MGSFGALVRWLQLLNAFEADSGLLIKGSASTAVLIAIMVFTAAALFLMAHLLGKTEVGFLGGQSRLWYWVSIFAGLLGLIGAVLCFFTAPYKTTPILYRILAIMLLLASLCMPLLIRSLQKRRTDDISHISACVLVIVACFWLIVSYKENASDPTLWHFLPELFASAAVSIAAYYAAGFVYGKKKYAAAVFFSNLAAFMCIVSLADQLEKWRYFVLIGFTLLLMSVSMVLENGNGQHVKT